MKLVTAGTRGLSALLVTCGLASTVALVGCEHRPTPSVGPVSAKAPEPVRPIDAVATPLVAEASAEVAKTALPEPETPAVVESIAVPSDSKASFVRSREGKAPVTVFLPGVCSNANAYLQSFPEAARAHGGIVAIDGDTPCPGAPGFHTFSWDPMKQHERIENALRAAGLERIPDEGITIVGYSQGATIAEKLAFAHPERYTRVVLIGAPTDPSVKSLAKARAVVTSACSFDVTFRMKSAAKKLEANGVPSLYVEMPGCTHGNVAEGERTFETAFRFLAENERPEAARDVTPTAQN
jgi:pimeloyl-ACP methyl ester carboxylesterase